MNVLIFFFTVANDSILDNAKILPVNSLLTEFTAMPYNHYKALASQSAAMVTSVSDSIYNINYGPTSYLPQISIENNGANIFTNNIGSISTFSSQTYTTYTMPLGGFVFPALSGDSADFIYKSLETICPQSFFLRLCFIIYSYGVITHCMNYFLDSAFIN